MSQACSGRSDGGAARRNATGRGAADGLALAAAPTFAIMAVLTGVLGGGPPDMLCSAAQQDASLLSGMVPMYLLMSAAEAGLQPTKRCPPVLIQRRNGDRRGGVG